MFGKDPIYRTKVIVRILLLLYYTLTLQRMLSVIRAAYYSVFTTKHLINFDEVESYMCIFA
jgi:hypothetical protein